jgi:hypothetical protein
VNGTKRLFIAVAILLFLSLATFFPLRAQIISDIGVKGGINFTNITFPLPAQPWNSKTGLIAGAFITFRINEFLSIQPEFLISEKGARWGGLSGGNIVTVTDEITYLDIPLLWKFNLPSLSKSGVQPHLYWGPCWSTKLIGTRSTQMDEQIKEDKIQDLNDEDFSLILGGGIEIKALTGKISFDLRFGSSYSSIFKTANNKNRIISILVGYSFD